MKPSICTASGLEFDLADPKPEQVYINDIAHALANTPRFGGHTSLEDAPFRQMGAAPDRSIALYSVAQHCCWVHDQLHGPERAYGLLHDAAEAYLCDMPAPAKLLCPDFCRVEINILIAVYRAFGLKPGNAVQKPMGVAYFDDLAWRAERYAFMAPADWWPAENELPAIGAPWGPLIAYRAFLTRFDNLVRAGYLAADKRRGPDSLDLRPEEIAHA